jgi:hypothetical protein
MSMTPYEIRLELLKLAQHSMSESAHMKRSALTEAFYQAKEIDKNHPFPELPSMPSTEDIIEEAAKLNDFVSNNY